MTIKMHNLHTLPRWPGPQRRIGLTGGIATGKSIVGSFLTEKLNLPTLDADIYARELLASGHQSTQIVLQHFGHAITKKNETTSIDRSALSKLIFNDPKARKWIENLLHPLIIKRINQEIQLLKNEPIVVLIVPLLFEAKLTGLCSEIWLVDCTEVQQRKRLMKRDGITKQEAQARIASQWPLSIKRKLCDFVIDNSGNTQAYLEQVKRLL